MTPDLFNHLDVRMARLEGSCEQLDKRLGSIDRRLDRFENRVEARFDKLDKKIDARFNLIALLGGLLIVLQVLNTLGIFNRPTP